MGRKSRAQGEARYLSLDLPAQTMRQGRQALRLIRRSVFCTIRALQHGTRSSTGSELFGRMPEAKHRFAKRGRAAMDGRSGVNLRYDVAPGTARFISPQIAPVVQLGPNCSGACPRRNTVSPSEDERPWMAGQALT